MLSGCVAFGPTTASPEPMSGVGLQGKVHGGEQPVVGAEMKLYAAGTTTQGPTSLLRNPVYTGPGGIFSITGDFTCPSPSSEIYLEAVGGNPGLADGTDNNAITLVAPLGPCGDLTANGFYVINEVTTVATAYALAGFITGEKIGGNFSNTAGLQNAFATANNLVDVHSGTALAVTPGGDGVPPQAEINTLADILSACVDTSNNQSPTCMTLFDNTTDMESNIPTDIFAAIVNLAQEPATEDSLTELVVANPPFQPTLPEEPTDWSVAIVYHGGGLQYPKSVAIDGFGNVWVSSDAIYVSNLSEFSPQGVAISPDPYGFDIGDNAVGPIAIDSKNNIWMPSEPGGSTSGVVEVSNNGKLLSPDPSLYPQLDGFAPGMLEDPYAIAIDFNDNIWISNASGVVVELNNSGLLLSPSTNPAGFTSPGYAIGATKAASATGIAIDTDNFIWVANAGQDSLVELNQDGFILTPPPGGVYGGGLDGVHNGNNTPDAVAVDIAGEIFTLNSLAATVSEFTPNRVALSPASGYPIEPNANSFFIAAGDIMYISLPNDNAIQFLRLLSPLGVATGIENPALNAPCGLAVDASGNLWVANCGSGYSGTITEVVGIALPTKTPIAVANQTLDFVP
jgi:hypothetical protein